eukprot:3040832-Karenia_brevis.AAC.1
MVWRGEHVNTHCLPAPPPWAQAVARGTPSNITQEEMLQITSVRRIGPAPSAHTVERRTAPQGLQQPWRPQLVPLTEADWHQGPQGTMSL